MSRVNFSDMFANAGEGLGNQEFTGIGPGFAAGFLRSMAAGKKNKREEEDREYLRQLHALQLDPQAHALELEHARLSNELMRQKLAGDGDGDGEEIFDLDLLSGGEVGMNGAPDPLDPSGGIALSPTSKGKFIARDRRTGAPMSGPMSESTAKWYLDLIGANTPERRAQQAENMAFYGLVRQQLDPFLEQADPETAAQVEYALAVGRSQSSPSEYRATAQAVQKLLESGADPKRVNELMRVPLIRQAEVLTASNAADIARYERMLIEEVAGFRAAIKPTAQAFEQEMPELAGVTTPEALTDTILISMGQGDPDMARSLRVMRDSSIGRLKVYRAEMQEALDRSATIFRPDEEPNVELFDRSQARGLAIEETLGYTYLTRAIRHHPDLIDDPEDLPSAIVNEARFDLRYMPQSYAESLATMTEASGQEGETESSAQSAPGRSAPGSARAPVVHGAETAQPSPKPFDPMSMLPEVRELLKSQGVTASDQEIIGYLNTPEGKSWLEAWGR